MNPGGGGCSELRLHHCTPAWVIQQEKERKGRKEKERKEGKKEGGREGGKERRRKKERKEGKLAGHGGACL